MAIETVTASRPRREVWQTDAAVAVVVTVIQVLGTYAAAQHQPERRAVDAFGVVLLAGASLGLAFRRRWPVEVLWVTLGATLAYWVAGYARGPVFLALIVAFMTAVFTGHRRAAIASLAAGYVGFLWLGPLLGRERGPGWGGPIALAAWLLVLLSAGEGIRLRRERAIDAAHVREEEARRRVSDERLRIARELHDVLAHNISLINVQASTTLHLMESNGGDDARARAALDTIKKVSQETLTEVRSVLGVLRQVDEVAPTAPAPTLSRLEDLVARAATAGIATDVVVEGSARPLPSAVDLAAYRIVQESLTNVIRHSDASSAVVRIEYGTGGLAVQVDDDGAGASNASTQGNGIAGMRERAAALGGNLQTGPRPDAPGFRVRAWFPVGTPS